jgi:hypothetical protein
VYLVDISGSMESSIDAVRYRLARSIATLRHGYAYHLGPTWITVNQHFHVIFFGPKVPVENPPQRLVPATESNKQQAAAFLGGESLVAEGGTRIIAGLRRAFEVLSQVRAAPGEEKALCLLSDGGFQSSAAHEVAYKDLRGNAAVLAWLRDHNPRGPAGARGASGASPPEVRIHTTLYGGDDQAAIEVMRRIARGHGGTFNHVGRDG